MSQLACRVKQTQRRATERFGDSLGSLSHAELLAYSRRVFREQSREEFAAFARSTGIRTDEAACWADKTLALVYGPAQ
jgi:hypothetical protein